MKILLIDFFDAALVATKNYAGLCRLHSDFISPSFDIITVLIKNQNEQWAKVCESFDIQWNHCPMEKWWGRKNGFRKNLLINDCGRILGEDLGVWEIRRLLLRQDKRKIFELGWEGRI